MVNADRIFVRCTITAVCVVVSLLLFVPLILLKAMEGVFLAVKVTKDSIAQVWRARGLPGLDK